MDKIVAKFVSAEVALAKRDVQNGKGNARKLAPGKPLRLLLVGYNGARNTGADARVDSLVKQIKRRFGSEVNVRVMTLDPKTTARLFQGAEQIRFSEVFFQDLRHACTWADAVMLCEGSTFKSTFADSLSLFFCQAAGIAREMGKPCIAYGSELGQLDDVLQQAVGDFASDVFFIARSHGSFEGARRMGLKTTLGTDTAWDFDSSQGSDEAQRILEAQGWDGGTPLLGVCPINPFWWPVRPSLPKLASTILGRNRSLQFSKMYFFSDSPKRQDSFDRYVRTIAEQVKKRCEADGYQPVVIGMERLDAEACHRVVEQLGGNVPVVLAAQHDAFVMVEVLRRLDLLVTSRYHARVLSAEKGIPAVHISMDERLSYLASDIGLDDRLTLDVLDANLGRNLDAAIDLALRSREATAQKLARYRADSLNKLDEMLDELQNFLRQAYPAFGRISAGA